MTVPTNTFVRSAVVGEREDLEDTIYRVVHEETPFSSNIGHQSGLHQCRRSDRNRFNRARPAAAFAGA